jgi:hypothetical protein
MKVSVSMTTEKESFDVSSWWASSPEFVISSLRRQLEAAQAVWPELKDFAVAKRRVRTKPDRAQQSGA